MADDTKNESGVGYWRVSEWFPDIGSEKAALLKTYYTELIFFNGRINLISPRSEFNADLVHFADSILACKAIMGNTKSREIFDIGSGNGFPGIVLALLYPDVSVRLIDSDARKIEFMKHIIAKLNLKNADTFHARLEDVGEGVIKCATTRGFASISKALLSSRKAAVVGCELYHLKGPAWSRELAEVPSQILAFWEPDKVMDYALPTGNVTHTVVLTRKKA